MTKVIAALAEVTDRYQALFCDLWGCLHDGVRPFPPAVAALQAFRASGGAVVLMTNAPRPSPAVIAQLDRMGVPRDAWDMVVSSGDASRLALAEGRVGRRVWHCGPEKDASFFADTGDGIDLSGIERVPLTDAEGVVCTGLVDDMTQTPADYAAHLEQALARSLPLLCTNPDIEVDMGERRVFCAGAIAQLYERMGGTAIYCGKPHPPIYHLARLRLDQAGQAAERILCVGDGILTDVRGGVEQGLDTCFITGGLAAAEFGPDPGAPHPGRLADWLAGHGLSPTFALAALR